MYPLGEVSPVLIAPSALYIEIAQTTAISGQAIE